MTFLEKLSARTAAVGNLCIGLGPRVENHNNRLSEVEDHLVRLIEDTTPVSCTHLRADKTQPYIE